MQGSFDATQFAPKQLGESHPVGKFPATIAETSLVENSKKTGGFLLVNFNTPAGNAAMRYNLWNTESPKAVEIAHGQLSALCHATGIFKLDWANEGAALRNARCMIEVGYQKGEEPSQDKPNGGYTEIKRVYDVNGNEPGKPGQTPQPQQGWGGAPAQQQQQPNPPQQSTNPNPPMQQQPGGGWGTTTQAPPNNPSPPQSGSGWGATQQQPQQQQPGPGNNNPPWRN